MRKMLNKVMRLFNKAAFRLYKWKLNRSLARFYKTRQVHDDNIYE
jgi:hypothetical protein